MTERVSVMVTGIGGGGHGEQILKALRFARTDYEIVGADMSAHSKGLEEVDHPYLLPPASDRSYISCLLKICKKHNVQAVFHGSEPELKVMSKERDRIVGAGIFLPINPADVIDICMDKSKTMNFLMENDYPHPHTIRIKCLEEVCEFDHLPAVLKPSVGGGGSANTFLAQTKKELHLFSEYLLTYYDAFVLQEYVGSPESEYTVGVLFSMDGEFMNSIAVKRNILSGLSNRIKVKNLTGKASMGPILAISSGVSQGEIGRFPEVTRPCEEVATRLGCRGPVNMQCRLVDRNVHIFEINPRFSGTTSLRAMVGYNEPDILIRKHLLGENVKPRFSYREGIIVRGLQETLMENIDSFHRVDSP
jgi:carbamoyl-phosphate synthase large subunit